MSSFVSKELLSASVNGASIAVTGTSAATAVAVHISGTGTTAMDEVWLYGYNAYGSNVPLSVYWAGTSNGNTQVFTLSPNVGRQLIYDGRLITNGGTVLASTVSNGLGGVQIDGFVNNISFA